MCTSTPWPWVADPHATSRDNDQGCGHSDAATWFPIPQRHGRPLCRAGHAVYRLLIFAIFAAKCCLAIEAELDRKGQTGSNMAQNHHGWPFCRMVSRELIAGHHILLGVAIFFPTSGNFFIRGPGGAIQNHNGTIGRSPLTIKCVLWFIPHRKLVA